MPVFDYECKCGHVEHNVIVKNADVVLFCPEPCNTKMTRLFPTRSGPFRIKGFRESNGYATNQFVSPIPGIKVSFPSED